MREDSRQCSGFPKVIKEGGVSVCYKMATAVRAPFVTVGTFLSTDTHSSASWSSKTQSNQPGANTKYVHFGKRNQSPAVKGFLFT